MADFKRQRIAGDGVSGADMLSHVNADDPHPQYSKSLEVASNAALTAHIDAEVPHTTVVLKADIVSDYNDAQNANKVVAASAIKDINNRLTAISNSITMNPSGYSAYMLDGTSIRSLGSSAYLDTTEVAPSNHMPFTTQDNSPCLGFYIFNGELFDTLGKKYTLDHLGLDTDVWSRISRDYIANDPWTVINGSRLFHKRSGQYSLDKYSKEFSQIKFTDSSFDTGWLDAIVNGNYSLLHDNYSYNSAPVTLVGTRADGIYLSILYFDEALTTIGSSNIPAISQAITNSIAASNTMTIPVAPQKIHYMVGSTKTAFTTYKKLIPTVYGTTGLGLILSSDNTLYKIPCVAYNSVDPVATPVLTDVQDIIPCFTECIAIMLDGSVKILKDDFTVKLDITNQACVPYTTITTNYGFQTGTRYSVAKGKLYKLTSGTHTEITSSIAVANKWTHVILGPRIGTTESAYAINNGDLYYISDETAIQLTTSKDYSGLLGGVDTCIAVKKNDGTVNMPEGVLTTSDVVNDFVMDSAKLIDAATLAAFREEYLLHNHDDRNDGLYLSKDHIDITKIDNPHSQYVLTRDLITSGVFVKDPLENSVAVFTSPDVAVDSSTLNISVDTDSCTATIVNNNAVGTARVWNSILSYDQVYSGKIVSRNSNGTYDRTAIEDTTTSTIGTDDTYNPCSFFIQNGKLYNTAIAIGVSADAPISPTLINNPGGATGIWTKVTGMTFRPGYYDIGGQLSAGVGIFNNKAYIILSDGTVVPVTGSPTGNWSMLVGSLIYSSVSTAMLVGAVWGICDGDLYTIGTGAVVGTAGIAHKVTSTTYPDITNWTMVNTKSRSGGGAVGISSGRIYRISVGINYGLYVFTITEEASEYTDFEQVYLTEASNVLLTRRSNGLAYFFNNILTPNVVNHPLGWTQLIAGYGIYNSELYRIIYNTLGVSSIVPVTINGSSTSGWTMITGSQQYGGQAISYGTNITMMRMYPVGICNGKAYIIENSTATLLSETSDTVSEVYGSVVVPINLATYKMPAVLVTEVPSSIELSAKNASYANKWVISKTINNIKTPLSVSNESALTVEPWLATWTTPNTYVTLDLSVNGYWKSVPVASLVQDATQAAKGVSKPAEDGGLSILDGNLSVAPEVARIQDLKTGTVPVYGYLSQNDDIIVSSGLDYKPYLKKTNIDAVDTARVWQNYDAYDANKVGIINNTTLSVMDLGLSITSTAESDDSSVACNYTIINGKLFYIVNPDTMSQIGSDTTWSKVTGIYQALANNIYTYAYGISNGRLYKIAEGVVTNLDSNTTGWTNICGYSSNNGTNFYAYAIRNGTLYYISNATVTAVSGITGTWSKISGIGGTYNGHVCTAYGVVYSTSLGTVLCKLATSAIQVPGSTANNWTALTGYTYLDSIAYAVQNGYLYKVTPFSISPIESTPNWTKLSGLGYANSGCCYGLCGTNLYAIKNTTVEQVGSDVGWTDVCGDYSNAFRRYGYGINRGHIYRLYDRYATKLTKDSGWSNIHGRSDVVDYVVCSKLSEHQYRLIADESSGSWLLQEYASGSYTTIATSYEPASGTDPWNCSWDNDVIVLDVLSHTGWTAVPLSELGGGGSGTVSWVRVQ